MFLNRGIALGNLNQKMDELYNYNMALKTDSTFAEAWLSRGIWYCENKNTLKGLLDIKNAYHLGLKESEYYLNLYSNEH
jgi:hypothetical protein